MILQQADLDNAIRFSFGDSPALTDELLGLVLAGKKTATRGALSQFGEGGEPMPEVGRRDIALDGKRRPAAVIEATEVIVSASTRWTSSSRARRAKATCRSSTGATPTRPISPAMAALPPDMEVVCELFEVIQVLPPEEEGQP